MRIRPPCLLFVALMSSLAIRSGLGYPVHGPARALQVGSRAWTPRSSASNLDPRRNALRQTVTELFRPFISTRPKGRSDEAVEAVVPHSGPRGRWVAIRRP